LNNGLNIGKKNDNPIPTHTLMQTPQVNGLKFSIFLSHLNTTSLVIIFDMAKTININSIMFISIYSFLLPTQ